MVLGSPGGSTIITTVANDIISVIDNGLNVQQAADAPRFHHQNQPDRIDVEKKFPLDVVDQLTRHGLHRHPLRGSRRQEPRRLGRQRDHRHRPPKPTSCWAATIPASTTAKQRATDPSTCMSHRHQFLRSVSKLPMGIR